MKKSLIFPILLSSFITLSAQAAKIYVTNSTGGLLTAVLQPCYGLVNAEGLDAGWDCKFYDTQVAPALVRTSNTSIQVNILDKPNAAAPAGNTWAQKPPFVYAPSQFVWASLSTGRAKPLVPWEGGVDSPCGSLANSTQPILFAATTSNQLICTGSPLLLK